jgi:hypothetical protein
MINAYDHAKGRHEVTELRHSNGVKRMAFVTIDHDEHQTTVVNTDQITYLRQDNYGAAIHFSSGEHVICPLDMESLVAKLAGKVRNDALMFSND